MYILFLSLSRAFHQRPRAPLFPLFLAARATVKERARVGEESAILHIEERERESAHTGRKFISRVVERERGELASCNGTRE